MMLLAPQNEPKQNGPGTDTGKGVLPKTTRSLNLSQEEARLLEEFAAGKGITASKWLRDVILRELHRGATHDALLAEILGVRLLLVNVLRPVAAGQRLSPEAFDSLLDEISTTKHDLAAKLLVQKRR